MRDSCPVIGRCTICGRIAPGIRKAPPSGECEGECPRCGRKPFILKNIGPYIFQNIVRLDEVEACAFMQSLETQPEVEACFRLEAVGQAREAVFLAGLDRYIELDDDPTMCRARTFRNGRDLAQIRREFDADLARPGVRSMYVSLMQAGLKGWTPEQEQRYRAAVSRARARVVLDAA